MKRNKKYKKKYNKIAGTVISILTLFFVILCLPDIDAAASSGEKAAVQKETADQQEDTTETGLQADEIVFLCNPDQPDADPWQDSAAGKTAGKETAGKETAGKETAGKETAAREITSCQGTLQVTLLDVGQGLSVLINADGHYMLYDGGGRESSDYVVAYLKSHEIDHLEYIFASHYDEDHIAGLVGVLKTCSVDTFVRPEYEADTDIYGSLTRAAEENGCENIYPLTGDVFRLGDAEITVYAPEEYDPDQENNCCIAARLVYGNFSMVMTGDAEEEEEEEILGTEYDVDSLVYVAGHHGSSSSTSPEMLAAVTPAYTLISCGEYNAYHHPAEETMEYLKEAGSEIFRTDKQGEIILTYEGSTNCLYANQEVCSDWTPGEDEPCTEETASEEVKTTEGGKAGAKTYILNMNTKKIHEPDCSSVDDMKEKNKKEVEATIEELEAEGYTTCKRCNPR